MGTWVPPRSSAGPSSGSRWTLPATCPPTYLYTTREAHVTVKRMDNILIVVDDLKAMEALFIALGLIVALAEQLPQ